MAADNAQRQRMVRLDIYVKRHPSLTSDEFHRSVLVLRYGKEQELIVSIDVGHKSMGLLSKDGWLRKVSTAIPR